MSAMPPDDSTEAMRVARWRAYLTEDGATFQGRAWRIATALNAGFTPQQVQSMADLNDADMLSAKRCAALVFGFWPWGT